MNKTATLTTTLILLLVGCVQKESTPLEMANRILLAQVASDVTVKIETASERQFAGADNRSFVCGRALVNQPGLVNNSIERFIISSDTALTHGLARFESSGPTTDTEFDELWSKNCANMVLPPPTFADVPGGAGAAALVTRVPESNFDTTIKTWPSDLKATDPVKLARAITAVEVDRKRGKFETTPEFNARIARLKDTKLYGNVTLGGAFAIDGGPLQYDANSGKAYFMTDYDLRASYDTGNARIYKEQVSAGGETAEEQSYGDYVKKNRFITPTHWRAIYIRSKSIKRFNRAVADIKMPREVAKSTLDDLRAFYVGNPVPNFYYTGHNLPEHDDPNIEHQTLLEFDLKGIWIVNQKTGQILSKKFWNCEEYRDKCH